MAIAQPPADGASVRSAIRNFAPRLHGSLIRPDEEAYDEARQVMNAAFDRRPSMIVKAADPADVIRTLMLARETGLPLAVRGGGHSIPGHSTVDGGIVLDLKPMRRLTIDPVTRVGWAEAGLTAGDYTAAAHDFGLATPFGDTASVGIAGLTLGGGIGYLVRRYGMTIDNLLSVELVTADGRLVTASENENEDLFWAIRGGGGNFGVVTAFQYRLHRVGTVFGGALLLPASRNVLRGFGPLAGVAPEELSMIASVMAAPPAPFVPADQVGKLSLAVLAVHAGDQGGGERAIAPIRSLAAPIADTLGPMPYPAIYQYTAEASQRHGSAVRSMFLRSLTDGAIDVILDFMGRATSPGAMAQIRILGGAMARVPAAATAFAHRDKQVMLTIITPFVGPAAAEEHEAWTQAFHDALRPYAEGVYVNFLADEGEERIAEAYSPETVQRLATLKARFDPDNFFRLNQNIRPNAA